MSEGKLPGRRDFLKIAAGTFVVAAVPISLRNRTRLVRRSIPAMGATAEIAVVHRDERYAYAAMDAALAEIQRIEKLMTRFSVTSDIGRANLRAAAEPVRISMQTAHVIQYGLDWAHGTDGAFDPAVAQIIDLWDVAHRTSPPAPPMVQRLANRALYKHVDVDTRAGLVSFAERDVALDLG
ncbi:MAG TPA: FAD:protein FMN transferase, partial [Longimicrobiales bacterium]